MNVILFYFIAHLINKILTAFHGHDGVQKFFYRALTKDRLR